MTDKAITASGASPSSQSAKVYAKAAFCLVLGLAIGYLVRESRSPAMQAGARAEKSPLPSDSTTGVSGMASLGGMKQVAVRHGAAMGGGRMPTLEEMKHMADTKAASPLEKLKTDPNNTVLLSQIGAMYHTTHQFRQAAVYYDRAVQADPKNIALRTKLASSLYRGDDIDGAIKELNQALKYDPKDANALFDLGMIKLNGKHDGKGALAAWQQLLRSNPQLGQDRKATVQKLMASVMTMLSDQHGMQGATTNDGHPSKLN
jgi:cytochrome c-type biogenesis protein CcmH/NrfG